VNILFGATGSIAAHRGLELARALSKAGHDVRVILTESAARFVQPTAFRALVGPTYTDENFFESALHIQLSEWAHMSLVAPATANTLAKLAHGRADDLLSASFLAKGPPGVLVPAMHESMWLSPMTQQNVQTLRQTGFTVLQPVSGDLSTGSGMGRMPELQEIFGLIEEWESVISRLEGVEVALAYGPTAEPIDPVRVITNRSSGKMGVAIGRALAAAGAKTTAVQGPGVPECPALRRFRVETGAQMRKALERAVESARVLIMAAAVADFKVAEVSSEKLARAGNLSLRLEPTQDILASLAENKRPDQVFVGFCLAEKQGLLETAMKKMRAKSVDIMVANDISSLGSETGEFYILTGSQVLKLGQLSKNQLAVRLVETIAEVLS